jgi:hypothetical protein
MRIMPGTPAGRVDVNPLPMIGVRQATGSSAE